MPGLEGILLRLATQCAALAPGFQRFWRENLWCCPHRAIIKKETSKLRKKIIFLPYFFFSFLFISKTTPFKIRRCMNLLTYIRYTMIIGALSGPLAAHDQQENTILGVLAYYDIPHASTENMLCKHAQQITYLLEHAHLSSTAITFFEYHMIQHKDYHICLQEMLVGACAHVATMINKMDIPLTYRSLLMDVAFDSACVTILRIMCDAAQVQSYIVSNDIADIPQETVEKTVDVGRAVAQAYIKKALKLSA
jgi:hypothetical protein